MVLLPSPLRSKIYCSLSQLCSSPQTSRSLRSITPLPELNGFTMQQRLCVCASLSHEFLVVLSRHPATTWNQKKIWEAEQKDAKTKRDEAAANKELYRDSERRRYEHMAGGKGEPDSSTTALNFMYAPPPGYQQVKLAISSFLHGRLW